MSIVTACIPTTTATIKLGVGYAEADLSQVEKIVENLGFTRVWVEPTKGERFPRTERENEIVSMFQTPISTSESGFGIGIHLQASDGSLQIIFAERNTQFSDRGIKLKERLILELQNLYGNKVSVDM